MINSHESVVDRSEFELLVKRSIKIKNQGNSGQHVIRASDLRLKEKNIQIQIPKNSSIKMPKQAKKKWRKNINLDDLYEGIQQTRQELASGYIS